MDNIYNRQQIGQMIEYQTIKYSQIIIVMQVNNQIEIPESKKVQKLRSNSIRNCSPLSNIGYSVKLNSKKFPVDFFHKDQHKNTRIRLLGSQRTQASKLHRRNDKAQYLQPQIIQTFPEAQITSFFKISQHSSATTDTTPSRNYGNENETRVSISEFDCVLTKQVSSSIELNEKNQSNNDFCCTFSRMPVSVSNIGTPQRKQNLLEKSEKMTAKQNSLSARFQRPSTKKQMRLDHKIRERKNSMDKIDKVNYEANESAKNKLARRQTGYELLCLPKIGKKLQ